MRTVLAVAFCSALALPAAWGQSAASDLDRRMQQIEAQLDAMEAQMHRIRAAADASERQKLVQAHARAWRETVAAVRELGRNFTPQMRAMMGGSEQIPSGDRMMYVQDLMARRVAIMERLMEQGVEQAIEHAGPEKPGK